MIAGVLLRNYKNYKNINFIPICDHVKYKFTAYIGNNGAGKSAILESLNAFLNGCEWNIAYDSKGSEAYICPMFLIEKGKISEKPIKDLSEVVSKYFWNADNSINANLYTTPELKKWLSFKESLKKTYNNDYYLILIGSKHAALKDAYFATFDDDIRKFTGKELGIDLNEIDKKMIELMQYIKELYSYIYIPVESSPQELLQLQDRTMQKLLNKDLLDEIEGILNKGDRNSSIVSQINSKLNSFMDDVNKVIHEVEPYYDFKNTQGCKKNISAKDIRDKILEAYFPLRTLKVNKLPVSQLSSGEQRKALIDVAYSILVSNKEKKVDKEILLGIDEPESSMHISNCFKYFQMLEKLASDYEKQIILTTHWYGFLPVAQNGNLNYIKYNENEKRELCSFSLFNIMEEQRKFPDSIELKSMFDLATSIITYMRTDKETSWIMCEGSDDKLYLECILNGIDKINILPMGGCGNVIKLYRIIYSSFTEKNEKKDGNILFIIDTDKKQAPAAEIIRFSGNNANINLRRLQIEQQIPKLHDPESKGSYEQTEIEDCLLPKLYFDALCNVINKNGNDLIKELIKNFEVKNDAKNSMLRNDETCLRAKSVEAIEKKSLIIEFAENDENKKLIAKEYRKIYEGQEIKEEHSLRNEIKRILNIQ